jgi:hypothetical protein
MLPQCNGKQQQETIATFPEKFDYRVFSFLVFLCEKIISIHRGRKAMSSIANVWHS